MGGRPGVCGQSHTCCYRLSAKGQKLQVARYEEDEDWFLTFFEEGSEVAVVTRSTVRKFTCPLVRASFSSSPLCPGEQGRFLTFCIVNGNILPKCLGILPAQKSNCFLKVCNDVALPFDTSAIRIAERWLQLPLLSSCMLEGDAVTKISRVAASCFRTSQSRCILWPRDWNFPGMNILPYRLFLCTIGSIVLVQGSFYA